MLASVRLMKWFGPDRARGYAICIAIAFAPTLVYYHHLAVTKGVDFAAFWAAARLAWSDPASSYRLAALQAVQSWIPQSSLNPFVNPPPFLLAVAPLGLLPFGVALCVFKALGVGAYAAATRGLRAFWPSLAFGATLANLVGGQNGLITGALFIGATQVLDRRPWLGGALFGALVIKPQLALLVPVALAFGGRWRAFAGAAISATGLLVASWLICGADTFRAFFAALSFQRVVLFDAALQGKMQTIFTTALAVGLDVRLAAACQVAGVIAATSVVARVWRGRHDTAGKCAALSACVTFATPYLYGYDLPLTFVALHWLARHETPLPWERVIIGLAFVSPLAASALAPLTLGVNPGLVPSSLLLFAVLRRLRAEPADAGSRRLTTRGAGASVVSAAASDVVARRNAQRRDVHPVAAGPATAAAVGRRLPAT